MNEFVDCIGRPLHVGQRVGVAFSYSRASVGYIRVGEIKSLEPFHMIWEVDSKTSPVMVFNKNRMVVLDVDSSED